MTCVCMQMILGSCGVDLSSILMFEWLTNSISILIFKLKFIGLESISFSQVDKTNNHIQHNDRKWRQNT